MSQSNYFQNFYALGYRRLVPIIPPAVGISANSTLFKRVGTKQDGRGKTPGLRGHDGLWFGFDWVPYECDEPDLTRWAAMGAGVGIKTGLQPDGSTLLGIDADTLDTDHAKIILDRVGAALGDLFVRVGNYPKALYLCRVNGPFQYARVEFGQRDASNRLMDRVEVLSDGRQFVAEGVHPKTGKTYAWPKGVPAYADLPVFTPDQITALLASLRPLLPAASELIIEGATTAISQGSLRGELEAVRRAVAATPNNHNTFPSRESYRDYGYAIKAALPDHPSEAFDIFATWCEGWAGPDGESNDIDIVEADWARMKPPYRRGASWLYALAEEYSGGAFQQADAYFEPVPDVDDEPLITVAERQHEERAHDVFPMLTLDEIMARQPPVFLIDRHIPQVSVGFLYSTPGAGKTFLALDASLSLAASFEQWHGDAINSDPETIVLYIAAEGSFGFRNRVKAWVKARSLDSAPKRFRMIERSIDFMDAEDIDKLLRTVRAIDGLRPCLIVVDTVSRAMPGADENLQKEMTLFVHACDRLKEAFRCAVLGVHHAGKNGDMRGSTVLLGAGDYVFKLERKTGSTIGRLICEKQKDAPDGWMEPYRFETIDLDDGQSSLVPSRAELGAGHAVALTPAAAKSVLQALGDAWEAGEPWGKTHHSKERFYERRMIQDFSFSAEQAAEIMELWIGTGIVVEDVSDRRSKRKGLRLNGALPADLATPYFEESDADGVFA